MVKIRIIPCLLLKNSGLVKTVRFHDPKYVGDPVNAVKIFNEKEVDELIFLDILASKDVRKPDFSFLSKIASECFMPLTYGGGIRSLDDVRRIFNLGVEKVCINSYAVENPLFVRRAAELFGSQSIVAAMDVKRNKDGYYEIMTYGNTTYTGCEPVAMAKRMEEMGAGELLVSSIDRDGTMQGYDIPLIKEVSKSVNIPVIACGGAGKMEDFVRAVREGGASAVAAGSMFVFQGKHRAVLMSYPERSEIEKAFDVGL